MTARRTFIAGLGAVAVWPLAARGQQSGRGRRVGVLMNSAADDAESQTRYAAFLQALAELGWAVGRNLRIDVRWSVPGDVDSYRKSAVDLNSLSPDAVLAANSPSFQSLRQTNRTVPIVFVNVSDPVGQGFVSSLSRPGGNVTGFTTGEFGTSAKWLELLKQIAPGMTRGAVLRDPTNSAEIGQFGAIQSAAPLLGVELIPLDVRDAGEIERAIMSFARGPNDGLIVLASAAATSHRDLIITLAARHRLPAAYADRVFVAAGGLLSYGPDRVDQFRRAAGYVDRILKGEKPADLPVQAPTKFELLINLKTAKALGLTVPPSLLATADEVIE
jgi:putative tryptophan/tyrosine transport system substrate-binding protein